MTISGTGSCDQTLAVKRFPEVGQKQKTERKEREREREREREERKLVITMAKLRMAHVKKKITLKKRKEKIDIPSSAKIWGGNKISSLGVFPKWNK